MCGASPSLDASAAIIFVPKMGSSPALGTGQTPEDGGEDPTSSPTDKASVSAYRWRADWEAFRCVADCDGPYPPCAGAPPKKKKGRKGGTMADADSNDANDDDDNNGVTFESLRECCGASFAGFVSRYWGPDECVGISGGVGVGRAGM